MIWLARTLNGIVPHPRRLLADRAYDGSQPATELAMRWIKAVISPTPSEDILITTTKPLTKAARHRAHVLPP
jgi:hypothetical protein